MGDREGGIVLPSNSERAGFGPIKGHNVIAGQNISGGTVNFNFHREFEDINRRHLKDLCTTDPRHDKTRIEQTKGGLLADSYRWILDNPDFKMWRDDRQSRLLWIRGDPGKGKTMLLCGIINELKAASDSGLLSFFFCQATDAGINNATAVLRGLIYLLVGQQPSLDMHVQKKYDAMGNPLFRGANAWVALSEILTDILKDPTLPPTYLVIDALDECIEGLDLLLSLVVRASSVNSGVKWIVSSRNWPIIEKHLSAATQQVRLSLELNGESVSTAVTTYIQLKVNWLAEWNGYSNDLRDVIERYLSANASGTFLWVALVCQELANTAEWEAEELLRTFPPGLDALYRRMMDQINNSRHAKLLQRILAAAAVVYRPITLEELPVLVDIPYRASGNDKALTEIIRLCGSFLTLRERTISFVHQSAKDFLLQQAQNEIFPSKVEEVHHNIFSRSLRAMQHTLRRNIYRLGTPGYSIDEVSPPDPDPLVVVRYSCVYWINHLCDCTHEIVNKDLQAGGSIDTFLREKYLQWLEALSLLRSMSEGIVSMLKLERLSKVKKATSIFIDLVRDMCRFALYHKWAIENSPLQVYTSALIFSPVRSIARAQFENEVPKWIVQKPIVADDWSACLLTLEGHSGEVNSVAWSHDASRLASVSDDQTVKIWDPATGRCMLTLEGHTGEVSSVTWSHDGAQLASASWDRTIKLWHPVTGQCLSTLKGHRSLVNYVAWSYDTTRLASASRDKTVKIWDPATSQCVSTLEGHNDSVNSVAWSYDTTGLASASTDKTVKIWDPATSQCVSTLKGHTEEVSSVAWSHDGTRLASASLDKTVKIWDSATGCSVSTLEGHSHLVRSVVWSHDGTRLASASWDRTVKIWDSATCQCLSTLKGHSGLVNYVAWSHDATRLASASDDETVKIWDSATGQYVSTFEGYSNSVNSVALSHDTTRSASASTDETVNIWDPATGRCLSTFKGHIGDVNAVAWSHDATQLASGSWDRTVKIWDPATGRAVSTFVGHSDSVNFVAWSSDTTRLASASGDKTVKIWDLTTSRCVSTLVGHSDSVNFVAWSYDTTRLASASWNRTVKIWDLATSRCVLTLESRGSWVRSMAWSYDTTRLAFASDDNTVKIWDPATGQYVSTLRGHSGEVSSLAWSYDGTQLASASRDRTIKLWHPATGQCLSTLEIGHYVWHLQYPYSHSGLLHTEGGILNLGHVANSSLCPASAGSLPLEATGYGLSDSDPWITYKGENLLWLPPEYRPSSFAISGTDFLIGCSSGRVLIFKFSDEVPVLN